MYFYLYALGKSSIALAMVHFSNKGERKNKRYNMAILKVNKYKLETFRES